VHTWGAWAVTTAPTAAEEGVETSTCSKCGVTKTQAVAALGCQCPAGTIHLAGEADCGGTGCECEINIAGARSNVSGKASTGIAITNRNGLDDTTFNTMVAAVNEALNHVQIQSETRQEYIKNNIKEIRIESGIESPVISNGIMTVKTASAASDIRSAFNTWLVLNSITMLNQSNKEAIKHA